VAGRAAVSTPAEAGLTRDAARHVVPARARHSHPVAQVTRYLVVRAARHWVGVHDYVVAPPLEATPVTRAGEKLRVRLEKGQGVRSFIEIGLSCQ
jgi:hypothetical protein